VNLLKDLWGSFWNFGMKFNLIAFFLAVGVIPLAVAVESGPDIGPDEAIQRLTDGNNRYTAGEATHPRTDAARAENSPYDWAFVRLDYARKEKVEQLKRFCERVHELAARARTDEVLVEFFDVNQKYYNMAHQGVASARFKSKITEFRKALNNYYVENYLAFYDVLFVDKRGNILHSIRKESDFQQNFIDGEPARTPLARCLQTDPREETFVDFHYYAASDEPAAFFVEPVHKDGEHLGWIVLQCAVNKINSLFAGAEQLGETGEAFVVNHQGYLLTESNFEGDSTILAKKLSSDNIRAKFDEKQGHRTVTDYRGFAALTSFEVVEFLGTQWLVVAKVDEAQVTTEHFMQHRKYYADKVIHHLASLPVGRGKEPFAKTGQKIIRVDMDEFIKANHGELLKTVGVSTCTAVIATYPGKFGYLAHISPLDKVYGAGATNLLGHITKKIKNYDIYKYERRRVRFVIVANHFDSLTSIIDKLVDEGFLLSQISVLYHPRARCANVTYDYSQDRVNVEWLLAQTRANRCIHHAGDSHNLETIVKHYLGG